MREARLVARARCDVAELRERIAASGVQFRSATDAVMLARVIDHVGDLELAADAIVMDPRPSWLRDLIGLDLVKVHRRV